MPKPDQSQGQNPELDAIDRRIVMALQADARLSNVDLAATVGLSPSPCLRRVKRLEREGYIEGYRASLRRDRVGLGLSVVDSPNSRRAARDRRYWAVPPKAKRFRNGGKIQDREGDHALRAPGFRSTNITFGVTQARDARSAGLRVERAAPRRPWRPGGGAERHRPC
jgi:DNA-binding Lrp family transcriptional regulator